MALKETLNGFSQTKETCCKVSNENKTHKYSAKNQFENGHCNCKTLKCKIVYDDIVFD